MRASLDTNIIIHLYGVEQEGILFDRFEEGIYVYSFLVEVELEHHASMQIKRRFQTDVDAGKITIIDDDYLQQNHVYTLFQAHVRENRILYGAGDLGEVYAIALSQTVGIYALVTDDTKLGGPHASLIRFPDTDIMPFTYVEVMLLNFLEGKLEANEVIQIVAQVNAASDMNWQLPGQLKKFICRFWKQPYQQREKDWMRDFCKTRNILAQHKLAELMCFFRK